MERPVVFSRKAKSQLTNLLRYISKASSPSIALSYTQAITHACFGLSTFSERGNERPEIRPGVRAIGFRRRVTITFRVREQDVLILGIFYGGQDLYRHSFPEEP